MFLRAADSEAMKPENLQEVFNDAMQALKTEPLHQEHSGIMYAEYLCT